MKVVKYKLSAFFAYHNSQPLPECPFRKDDHPGTLAGGRLGQYHKILLRKTSPEERLGFLESCKRLKKGMPRPSKEEISVKVDEFVQTITTPQEHTPVRSLLVRWTEVEGYQESVELAVNEFAMKQQLRRTVFEIFKDTHYTPADRVRMLFPSTSANYIRNRKEGGAVAEILDHPSLLTGLRTHMGARERIHIHGEIKERESMEEEINQIEEDRESLEYQIKTNFGDLGSRFAEFWQRLLQDAAQEEPLVEPVGLPEALKIRIITKGPPLRQTVLTSLWKKMHTVVRQHPAFKLIGSQVDESYILERLGRTLTGNQKFLSGDFEAATDNLFSWVSKEIAIAISDCLQLTPIETELFVDSLINHKFVTAAEDGQPVIKLQRRGQLMGSITSFVVLCIANATCLRWSCEIDQKRKLTLKDAPIMVNGDDGGARCTEVGYKAWRAIIAACGFKESVGKTYFTEKFFEINSTIFMYSPDSCNHILSTRSDGKLITRQTPFLLVKYVNMGLLTGMKRSGGKVTKNDQKDPLNNIGTRYRELLKLSPPNFISHVHKKFIRTHRKILQDLPGLPWHIPEWLGGLGLTGYITPSDLDRKIARRILTEWKKRRPQDPTTKQGVPWFIWEIASRRLGVPYYETKETEGTRNYDTLAGKECVNLLFDSSVRLSDLYDPMAGQNYDRVNKALLHNRRIWNPAKGVFKDGLTDAQLVRRLRYPSLYPEPHATSNKTPLVTIQLDDV